MAALNTNETEQTTSTNGKKSPTHFVNVSVIAKGKPIKIGAIPLFADSMDKAQRTLLEIFNKNPDAVMQLDTMIDVRENVKSTETYDPADWDLVDREIIKNEV